MTEPVPMTDAARVALSTIARLELNLSQRKHYVDDYDRYYDGDHNLRFASTEFAEFFRKRYSGFRDNWCQAVADAPAERLTPVGIRLAGDDRGADRDLWEFWRRSGCDADVGMAFTDSFIGGRSFGMVWGDDVDITFEHASQVIVEYEPGSRRKRRAALKLWTDGVKDFATLYTPSLVWKWERHTTSNQDEMDKRLAQPERGNGWQPRQGEQDNTWPIPNPLGQVPVVELPNKQRLVKPPVSELELVAPMQDAINMLWAHLFTASDAAALPQRVLLGADWPQVPVRDKTDPSKIVGTRPMQTGELHQNRVLTVPGTDVKIGEWSAADLGKFLAVIEQVVKHMAAQTRTPPHYLLGEIVNISAEALKAAETGLIKKCQERTVYFGESLKSLMSMAAIASGQPDKARAVLGGELLWKDVESRSNAQLMDALLKMASVGFPREYIYEQWTQDPDEVRRLLAMSRAEQQEILSGITPDKEEVGDVKAQIDAMGSAIRAGVAPESAAATVGLDGVQFTGAVPVSLRLPQAEAADLEVA